MKRIFRIFSGLIVAMALTGCITNFSPKEDLIVLEQGESQQFTAASDDPTAKLVWYLDAVKVASGPKTFTFTAEQFSGDKDVKHILIVREEGGRFAQLYKLIGLPSSVSWTIRVLPAICADGETREVTCGAGACMANGIETCSNNNWGGSTCVPGLPTEESCDAIDNDCDGTIDNDIETQATTCGIGACIRSGLLSCENGVMNDSCVPGDPSEEISDGLDNDCDGEVDEDIVPIICIEGNTRPMVCGIGACMVTGLETCINNTWVGNCVPAESSPEVCDGIDNDCDGIVDPDIPSQPTTCGIGACASVGESACFNGAMIDSCVPGTPTAEICDEVDNNCDGQIDEGNVCGDCADGQTQEVTCGAGACAVTQTVTCTNRQWPACIPGTPTAEVCDSIDNDCNGSVDDGLIAQATTCGTGACTRTGEMACVEGQLIDSCQAGTPSIEVCDGADNDCNGSVDDGLTAQATTCGTGACARTGEQACIGGQLIDSCQAGTPSIEVCDGADNDCNGSVDDGLTAQATTCGTGACARTGEQACIGGQLIDSCQAGAPATEVCDGADNDCNGSVDDGLAVQATTCGTGACARTGEQACIGGQLIDSCQEGMPAPEVCDGTDNDCNGSVDEGIAAVPTNCGVGACAGRGELACVGGELVDSCQAGTPAAEVCDSADNNCDGAVDEGVQLTFYRDADGDTYGNAGIATQACLAPAGYVADGSDCNDNEIGIHLGAEEICSNGIDDNCDARIDEDCIDPDLLAQDGLNLLIDQLQSYMVSGATPTSIEDILPSSMIEDIRINYFQAALDLESDNPSAHFGFAILELVQIAYDVDSVAIIDLLLGMLTGAGSSDLADLGGMAAMLFDILNSSAADYLNNALAHMDFAVNLDTDIVLQLYMPMMVVDANGDPVLDPETGRPQFQKDADGRVVFESEKSSYQLDQTDVLLIRGVINLGVGALHLYNAYDLNIADETGSYDYFGEIQKDEVTGKIDLASFQGLLLALEHNDKRSEFLTMLPGGAIEAQASKVAFDAAFTDVQSALNSLMAETDDQTDDIITMERMEKIYDTLINMMAKFGGSLGLPEFSFEAMSTLLTMIGDVLNSTAANPYAFSFEMDDTATAIEGDTVTIAFNLNLSRVFTGVLTNIHQYLPYHYWFYLDNTTAYPPTFPAKAMVDDSIGMLYGLTLPIPLNANYPESQLTGKTLLGPFYRLGDGLIGSSTIVVDNLFADPPTVEMTVVFPDLTFGGLVQGLSQAEVDLVMKKLTSALFSQTQSQP